MNRSLTQIDGANFYYMCKRLCPSIHLSDFKYRELIIHVVTERVSMNIVYYVGEIKYSKRSKKSQELFAQQQYLFERLKDQNISIKLGYLLKTGNKYHEKGVDVQIAVDMVKGALSNGYSSFFLLSSDSDLLPAIKVARRCGKRVVYVGFEGHLSNALSKNCDEVVIITRVDIKRFRG